MGCAPALLRLLRQAGDEHSPVVIAWDPDGSDLVPFLRPLGLFHDEY